MRTFAILLLLTSSTYATDLRDGAPCHRSWLDKSGRAVTIVVNGECVYAAQFPNVKPRHVKPRRFSSSRVCCARDNPLFCFICTKE